VFLLLRGALSIGRAASDGGPVTVHPGEFFAAPRSIRHHTSAADETWIALIEIVSIAHTGSEAMPLTRSLAEQLAPID
jgi:quercetin dioxygenase-like cupin family protein